MKIRSRTTRSRITVWLCVCLVAMPVLAKDPVQVELARSDTPPELLLDVGIELFDPGLPEDDPHGEEDKAVYPEVRRSEARFIAFHLKETLEKTGYWGAVRVLPTHAEGVDVTVSGRINVSTGMQMSVDVRVVDARGRRWRQRRYKQQADFRAYSDPLELVEDFDPFQTLYNQIANDMVAARTKLSDEDIAEIREISRLRFAADVAPTVYGDYFEFNKKGRCKVRQLPAADDPMLDRVTRIRESDELLVDTLNEYYGSFYSRMADPYDDYRLHSFRELQLLRAIRREARMQKILGGLLIVGAAVTGGGGSTASRAARSAAAVGGGMLVAEGMETGKQGKIHVEAMRELAQSFDAEMEPVLVEIEGQVLRLEGSAEAQYEEWRRLMADIFAEEVGLPVDPNAESDSTATGNTGS